MPSTAALSCPECGRPAIGRPAGTTRPRRGTMPAFLHADGRPLCSTTLLGQPTRAWPVDPAATAAPTVAGLLARPVRHPCRTTGTAIGVTLLAGGPVIADARGLIDCAATGGCGWRTGGPDPAGTLIAVPAGRGCWLDAATVQHHVVALAGAGHLLPYQVSGLVPGYLDPDRCRALAAWLHRHTTSQPAPDPARRPVVGSAVATGYASRCLAWVADHGGARVLRTGPTSADTRMRAGSGHPDSPVSAPPVLTDLVATGSRDGANAADWWAQDTVGGRSTGDVTTKARTLLAGIDDGDPRVLDLLPRLPEPTMEDAGELYREATGAHAPRWEDLDPLRRQEAIAVYRDAYDTAAEQRAATHCRTAAELAA
ncbi:hypothetical protein [Micromonospora sp. WMMD1082]|uniref:hypothetical protein n=1 Tax=Micromonospora sp. WMMD1082 TaxID=3016104 RepID=UPI00241651F1|nr:hypothetical protein [Micromonospora sp. WMMD1082]MDG4795026.1 hypothetical protein [Micromonospora sp. WMMD1082]